MKKILIILVLLIAIVWYIMPVQQNSENLENDVRIYEQPWRSPNNNEIAKIAKTMIDNHISGCGEFHIKEIENGEYIIACHVNGESWKYLISWPSSGTISQVNVEMELKLEPPY